ncbi:hypothetical protein ACFL4F_03465 [Candidatus Margulisiibacteriota bacterium]
MKSVASLLLILFLISSTSYSMGNNPSGKEPSRSNNIEELNNSIIVAVEKALDEKYVRPKEVLVIDIHSSQKAAYGYSHGDLIMGGPCKLDWVGYKQDGGSWKILLSFDGYKREEIDRIPSKYKDFLNINIGKAII